MCSFSNYFWGEQGRNDRRRAPLGISGWVSAAGYQRLGISGWVSAKAQVWPGAVTVSMIAGDLALGRRIYKQIPLITANML
jgi:hypothetical protein